MTFDLLGQNIWFMTFDILVLSSIWTYQFLLIIVVLFFAAGIKGQVDFLMSNGICTDAPAELQCETNFPGFWSAIASALFNPEDGWYAPANLCSVSFFLLVEINAFKPTDPSPPLFKNITCSNFSNIFIL